MSKIYVQGSEEVFINSASIAAGGSVSSEIFITKGYAKITGILISSASAKAGSGLSIWQSGDYGQNWDYRTIYAPTACSGSGFSIEVIGNAAKIDYITDGAANIFRTAWHLRPI